MKKATYFIDSTVQVVPTVFHPHVVWDLFTITFTGELIPLEPFVQPVPCFQFDILDLRFVEAPYDVVRCRGDLNSDPSVQYRYKFRYPNIDELRRRRAERTAHAHTIVKQKALQYNRRVLDERYTEFSERTVDCLR
jgi:hypothetical protein